MTTQQSEARRTIEALRAGVPSRAAVKRLGTTQLRIREEFDERLGEVIAGRGVKPLVVAASYGDGKSHLLKCLESAAQDAGFVTSYLLVSPEMPLGRSHVVLQALAEAAEAPGLAGKALRALTAKLENVSQRFGELRQWAEQAGLDERFAALLLLFGEFRADEELRQQILDDIEGKPLKVTDIRTKLRELGRQGLYSLTAGPHAGLAQSRIRLYAQLCRVATGAGMVVLFDEVERLVTFTRRQRFAAYEQIGWWSERAAEAGSGILPVFAMTRGLVEEAITNGKLDAQQYHLAVEQMDPVQQSLGQQGLRLLQAKPLGLQPPEPAQLEAIRHRIREVYTEAYGAFPGDPPPTAALPSTLRARIRAWITGWDLRRHYREYIAQVEAGEVVHDAHEVPDALLPEDENSEG